MVIYTTAGTHPILNDYSHGSRFPCQNVYIYGCRASSIKVLFTGQPFVSHDKGCRLSSIKALFTRQPFSVQNVLYTLLPCLQYEMDIYTAVIPKAKIITNKKNARIVCFLETKLIKYHVSLCKMQNASRHEFKFFSTECNIFCVCGHFYQLKEN